MLLPQAAKGDISLTDIERGLAYKFRCDYGLEGQLQREASSHLFRGASLLGDSAGFQSSAANRPRFYSPSPRIADGSMVFAMRGEEWGGLLLGATNRRDAQRLIHEHRTLYWDPILTPDGRRVLACFADANGRCGLAAIDAATGRDELLSLPAHCFPESTTFLHADTTSGRNLFAVLLQEKERTLLRTVEWTEERPEWSGEYEPIGRDNGKIGRPRRFALLDNETGVFLIESRSRSEGWTEAGWSGIWRKFSPENLFAPRSGSGGWPGLEPELAHEAAMDGPEKAGADDRDKPFFIELPWAGKTPSLDIAINPVPPVRAQRLAWGDLSAIFEAGAADDVVLLEKHVRFPKTVSRLARPVECAGMGVGPGASSGARSEKNISQRLLVGTKTGLYRFAPAFGCVRLRRLAAGCFDDIASSC